MHQWVNELIDMSSKYFYQLPSDWQLIVFLALIVFGVMAIFLTASAILYLVLYVVWKFIEALFTSLLNLLKRLVKAVMGG